jgi:lysozyme
VTIDYEVMADELDSDEDGRAGMRLTVYDDATGKPLHPGDTLIGHPTIGIGRALDTHGISLTEGRCLIMNDIAVYCLELRRLGWFTTMDDVRQRAIINMRHQLGLAGLLRFNEMIRYISVKDYQAASRAGLASDWARETPNRARHVMSQLATGVPPLLS